MLEVKKYNKNEKCIKTQQYENKKKVRKKKEISLQSLQKIFSRRKKNNIVE